MGTIYLYTNGPPGFTNTAKKVLKSNPSPVMKAVLMRAGSLPVPSPALCGSPKASLSRQRSIGAVFSGETTGSFHCSSIISTHFPKDKLKPKETQTQIRRASSDIAVMISESLIPNGSRCLPTGTLDEEYLPVAGVDSEFGTLLAGNGSGFGPGISLEDIGFSGNGFGSDGKPGDDRGDEWFGDKSKIGDHYREMLKLNPGDSLLLRNYGKFLHEVEKDMEGAEEYYGRAILASPGDGEVLCLYGNLIWEMHRDESRAKSYFDRAATASPNDCMVLGSYASFMWDAEEEETEMGNKVGVSPALIAAF